MNKYEAEKIVNGYGAAIGKGTEEGRVRRKSNLPCSKAQIKQAYFVYIGAIIEETKTLPKDLGEKLVVTYSMMNGFIDDEQADEMIEVIRLMKAKKLKDNNPSDKKKIDLLTAYSLTSIGDGELIDEINEYIGECYKKAGIE